MVNGDSVFQDRLRQFCHSNLDPQSVPEETRRSLVQKAAQQLSDDQIAELGEPWSALIQEVSRKSA
jgi:hypothetical protein